MTAQPRPSAVQRAESSSGRVLLWIAIGIGVALGWAAVLAGLFVLRPYEVSSSSMEPGLRARDYVIAFHGAYDPAYANWPLLGSYVAKTPARGDVVLFRIAREPGAGIGPVSLKRVVGLPGDRIQMRAGLLQINGQQVAQQVLTEMLEPALAGDPERPVGGLVSQETLPGGATYRVLDLRPGSFMDNTAAIDVPVGSYFVLGDNRDNSVDSRMVGAAGLGLVPFENLIGRAELIVYGFQESGHWPDFGRVFTRIR